MRSFEPRLPPRLRAVVAALRFNGRDPEPLLRLSEDDWRQMLAFCDRHQLTLPLASAAEGHLPDWVHDRVAGDAGRNAQRWRNTRAAYEGIAHTLHAAGIEHVVLKGFTQCPEFVPDPALRVQYDLDLLLQDRDLTAACELIRWLGYEPIAETGNPVDHLPVMIRKTGWKWRGDYFDPEIPPAVELHFRLWDPATERFSPDGLEAFWERRVTEAFFDGLRFPAFDLPDRLAYSTLHLLRHLLRGDLRPGHVYELAAFLHRHHGNSAFWRRWRESHPDSLRRLELLAFHLADAWFQCGVPEGAADLNLPPTVDRWLARYALAPLESLVTPNKHELWLHLSLLEHASDRRLMLRRRLLPFTIPGPSVGVQVPEHERTLALRIRMRVSQATRIVSRSTHHARALLPTTWHGLRWWWSGLEISPQFGAFLASAALFELGMFVFVLLYNLHLLDAGFKEGALGAIAGAMTAGSLAGALPAGYLVGRWRPNIILSAAFLALSAASVGRTVATNETPLIALAFLAGCLLSLWTVAFAPAISSFTTERSRTTAFSIFVATGIGLGVAGGALAGQLPGWLAHWGVARPRQGALFAGCALIAAAALPVLRLRIAPRAPEERAYPRSPFVVRYLAAFALWNLATGAFNPFFNAYFAQHLHLPVERIGWVFSASQFMQVLAILVAPAAFRRFGLIGGIAGMQAVTALALLSLAFVPASAAAGAYIAYMAFQYMSEPGMFTFLMNNVKSGERGGASALNLFVMYGAQGLAAAAAGSLFARLGYSLPLGMAALTAFAAAVCFHVLFRGRHSSSTAQTLS